MPVHGAVRVLLPWKQDEQTVVMKVTWSCTVSQHFLSQSQAHFSRIEGASVQHQTSVTGRLFYSAARPAQTPACKQTTALNAFDTLSIDLIITTK